MASYMPQHVFNMCAVTAVQFIDSEGTTIEEFAKRISDSYRRHYIDDGYEEDIVLAARNIEKFIESSFPDTKATVAVRQLQYCIKKFHPNGKKRFFLQGIIFTQQNSPLSNRVKQCINDVVVFHLGTLSGKFPIAPHDWSL
ncbi:MAG: hypothetical protein K2Q17_05980 [Nitrospiraceae bacterium]|jgi:hypothetical protein|uniref:hypothetical protein n=1 Tax=Nitrospira cf. moscoviensis SBR1015 TaxID=96242 RepID=UPI000A09B777|nr:hypothetical protein [Nitrospira cf. moscoviensis SBR1015]MBY0247199.1 hypothetical protein [Nitrospiraceae bacterium]OQW31194.1 MAG: hypothetical protein A4E20_15560 [Nitrospira sp. SG-bin2]